MAKKSFGVRKSLSVQAKPISPDEVEKAIQKIHQPEKPIVKAPTPKPRKEPIQKAVPAPEIEEAKPKAKKTKAAPKKEKQQRKVRLSVDVTPQIHKRLKIRAIEKDSDIMRYVAMLIEKDLAK